MSFWQTIFEKYPSFEIVRFGRKTDVKVEACRLDIPKDRMRKLPDKLLGIRILHKWETNKHTLNSAQLITEMLSTFKFTFNSEFGYARNISTFQCVATLVFFSAV